MTFYLAIFDLASRRFVRVQATTNPDRFKELAGDGQDVRRVKEPFDIDTHYAADDEDKIGVIGDGGAGDPGTTGRWRPPVPEEPPVTAAQVKAECTRRISSAYPLGKQITLLDEGGPDADAYRQFRDAMRAASHRLEAMDPIPTDFNDDVHWTGDSNG